MAANVKSKKKKIPRVKAIGFGNYSPHVVVIFSSYSPRPIDRAFMFQPAEDGSWTFPDDETDDQRNYVIVTSLEQLINLKPFSKRIYRLLVFSKPEDLIRLNIPMVDVMVDEEGKITKIEEQTIDTVRKKIEDDAVSLKLSKKSFDSNSKTLYNSGRKEEDVKKVSSQPTTEKPSKEDPLIYHLKRLNKKFSGTKVDFENTIMIPTLLRLVSDISRSEFKESCSESTSFGITKPVISKYRKFVEGSVEPFTKAVKRVNFPKKGKKPLSPDKAASKYEVSLRDLKLVLLALERLKKIVD